MVWAGGAPGALRLCPRTLQEGGCCPRLQAWIWGKMPDESQVLGSWVWLHRAQKTHNHCSGLCWCLPWRQTLTRPLQLSGHGEGSTHADIGDPGRAAEAVPVVSRVTPVALGSWDLGWRGTHHGRSERAGLEALAPGHPFGSPTEPQLSFLLGDCFLPQKNVGVGVGPLSVVGREQREPREEWTGGHPGPVPVVTLSEWGRGHQHLYLKQEF